MADVTIYSRGSDNIFADATIGGSTPSDTYSLATLLLMNPAARVRYGSNGITVTWTLDEAKRGDVFCCPMWNLTDGGSPGLSVVLSTNSGMSVAITPASMQANGLPNTTVEDLTVLEPDAAKRTATVWTLTISGNLTDVILGGAIAVFGPRRILDPDLQWGFRPQKRAGRQQQQNSHLTRYTVTHRTVERTVVASLRTNDLAGVEAWFDEDYGSTAPSLLWPQGVTGLDAYLGNWPETFDPQNIEGTEYFDVALPFTELSKGKPF